MSVRDWSHLDWQDAIARLLTMVLAVLLLAMGVLVMLGCVENRILTVNGSPETHAKDKSERTNAPRGPDVALPQPADRR